MIKIPKPSMVRRNCTLQDFTAMAAVRATTVGLSENIYALYEGHIVFEAADHCYTFNLKEGIVRVYKFSLEVQV